MTFPLLRTAAAVPPIQQTPGRQSGFVRCRELIQASPAPVTVFLSRDERVDPTESSSARHAAGTFTTRRFRFFDHGLWQCSSRFALATICASHGAPEKIST